MESGLVLHLFVEKSMHRIAPPLSCTGIVLHLKVLRSLVAYCSNKVYVSDVNTMCWGSVTSVCNWLPLYRRNTAGSLETRCCFQSNRGQASLDEECLHLPIPGPKRNMEGNFGGIIIILAHVSILPSVWHYSQCQEQSNQNGCPWSEDYEEDITAVRFLFTGLHGLGSILDFATADVEGSWKYHLFSSGFNF